MGFTGTIYGPMAGWLTPTSAQRLPLGTRMVTADGRVYRYAKAGALDLAIGKLMQECVVATDHLKDLVPAAAVIGATAVTLTNGASTTITADLYKEGYLFVNNEAGEGQICKIKSHPAIAVNVAGVITLEDEDALTVALTTASRIGLRKNAYDGALINPTTATGIPIGVTPGAIAATRYGWLQTWGPCNVLTNGAVLVGKTVSPGGTTPGSVDVYPLNSGDNNGQEPVVGYVMSVGATTEYSLVFLTLAP